MLEFIERFLKMYHNPNIVVLAIGCLFGALNWSYFDRSFRLVIIYLWFSFFIESAARIAGLLWNNNLPLLHLLVIGELVIWSLFYREVLPPNSFVKKHFKLIFGVLLCLVICNTLFVQTLLNFNTYGKTLVQLALIWFAIEYAFSIPSADLAGKIKIQMLNVVNGAAALYYFGSLFIFMSGFFMKYDSLFAYIRNINVALNTVFQILVLFALWKVRYKQTRSYSSSPPPF
jgi:hypothetical protein